MDSDKKKKKKRFKKRKLIYNIGTFQSQDGRAAYVGNKLVSLIEYWSGSDQFTFIWPIKCQHVTK